MSQVQAKSLTKRAYDNRLFSVDVSKKLRPGDMVTDFMEVVAQAVETDVAVTGLITTVPEEDQFEKISTGNILNFYCGAGQSGITYEVALRYASTNEDQLESVIRVRIV